MLICLLNSIQLILAFVLVAVLFSKLFGFEFRDSKIPFIAFGIIIIVSCIVSAFMIDAAEDVDVIKEGLLLFVFVVSPCLLFLKTKKLLLPVLGLTVNATIDYLVFIITSSVNIVSFRATGIIYCAVYAVVIVLLFIFKDKINSRLMQDFFSSISPWFYVVILIADWSAYYDVVLNSDASYYIEVSNAIRLISTLMLLGGLIYIVSKYTRSIHKEKEAELQVNMQMKLYSEMMKKNRDIREFRHDYKNNLFSIGAFIDSEKYGEAKKYIEKLNVALNTTQNRFATGNYLADAILTDKADGAEDYGIEIDFRGTVPEKGIENNDLCTVLANSIDNAVRGCQKCAPCRIIVDSKENFAGVIITIKNPVTEKVIIKDNKIRTTKSDKENHGIGLGNIKKTAEKYGGYVELRCDGDFFEIEIGLYFKNTED